MGMYHFFMFGIFLNIDFNALLAWLAIPPSSKQLLTLNRGANSLS